MFITVAGALRRRSSQLEGPNNVPHECARVRILAVHHHLVGPLPMPLSAWTFAQLRRIRNEEEVRWGSVVFVGALYDPRRAFLREVQNRLRLAGVDLDLRVREAGGPRISNEE